MPIMGTTGAVLGLKIEEDLPVVEDASVAMEVAGLESMNVGADAPKVTNDDK